MSPTQYQRLIELFESALTLSDADREQFVTANCRQDAVLLQRLREMLRAAEAPGDSVASEIGRSIRVLAADVADADRRGQTVQSSFGSARLGKYELLDLIGEGGMGAVYRARQDHPRRIVAVKIIRSAFSSPELVRRFEREAETLGRLHHPGIAHVYEAGFATLEQPGSVGPGSDNDSSSTRSDRADTTLDIRNPSSPSSRPAWTALPQPYIAMEYIAGESLIGVIHAGAWTIRQRLEFMARVCDAVHHAHVAGVIHRDLKPGNILVVDQAVTDAAREGEAPPRQEFGAVRTRTAGHEPKILDFGIARMIGASDVPATVHTEVGQLVGTIPYMSPEQIAGDSRLLDVRTDVYSLGVILFELLTGRLPYDVRNCSVPEAARIIREEEPSRLSRSGSRWRSNDFDRDIETIVLKAMEKDRTRRYSAAADLAADIRRFLRDEPIIARPASNLYQMRKFAKRHRALVMGTAATFLTLIVGLGVSLALFRDAVVAQRAADENSKIARRNELEAQRLAYRSSIAAATSALLNDDIVMADANLERVPESLRKWEWRHFKNRIDPGGKQIIVRSPVESFSALGAGGRELLCLLGAYPSSVTIERFALDGSALDMWTIPASTMAALSPNGRFLAYLTFDHVIRIRDTVSNEQIGVVPTAPGADNLNGEIAISEDGRWIAHLHANSAQGSEFITDRFEIGSGRADTCAMDFGTDVRISVRGDVLVRDRNVRELILWRANDDARLRFTEGDGNVRAASFSPSGDLFASGGFGNTLRLWDTRGANCVATGRGHRDSIERIAFSSDGQQLATVSRDRTIRIWDVPTLAPRGVLNGHRAPLSNVAFTPDGDGLASLDQTGNLRFWRLPRDIDSGVLRGHQSYVYAAAFSRDGELLASGGWDRTIRVWNPHTQRQVSLLKTELPVIDALAFGGDQHNLIAHGKVREKVSRTEWWDVQRGEMVGSVEGTAWPPLLTRSDDSELVVGFDPQTLMAEVWKPILKTVERKMIDPSDFLATYSARAPIDAELRAKLVNDAELFILSRDRQRWDALHPIVWTGKFRVSPPAIQPTLIAAPDSATNVVFVWDVDSRALVATLRAHTDEVFAVAWTPDGSRLATAGRDQMIRLWDTQTWDEVAQLYGHTSYVWSLEFSPDGSQLASASGDYTVRIWNTTPARR